MTKLRLAGLALLVLALPALAQPPAVVTRPTEPALAAVPTDSFLFVSVKASKLWDNPAARPFRDWVASQKDGAAEAFVGVNPADVDRLTMFLAGAPEDRPEPVVILTTRKPYNEARVLKALGLGENGGGRGRRVGGRVFEIDGAFRWVALIDETTILYLSRNFDESAVGLVAQLLARKTDGPLASALLDAQNHDFTLGLNVRDLAGLVGERGGGPDRELAPFLSLLKARTATLTADFDKTARVRLSLSFPDAAAAKRAAPVLEEGMKTVAEKFADFEQNSAKSDALPRALAAWGISVLKNAKATADGTTVVATADVPYADELAKAVAALPKSVAVARGNRRAMNNLKQLVIGMHNIHDTYGMFPGDVGWFAGEKNPPISWRVSILPFIEEGNLYQKLNPNLPWNNEANLKVLEAADMPKVFEHPGRPAPKNHTYFRIFTLPKNAKGTERPLFKEGERGPRITDITDGTSNTFMIVEAGEAVPWYKPDVLAYDGKLPLPQLGSKDADLFLAAMCDGSVRAVRPRRVGEKNLRAYITINGGEVIVDNER